MPYGGPKLESRTDSIRVISILKLDHAAKAAAEEQFEGEIPSEDEVA